METKKNIKIKTNFEQNVSSDEDEEEDFVVNKEDSSSSGYTDDDEEPAEKDNKHIEWKLTNGPPINPNFLTNQMNHCTEPEYDFTENVVNIPDAMKKNPQPYDFFKLLLPDDFLEHIVTETNRYAEQTITNLRNTKKLKPGSSVNNWKEVSKENVMVYIGLIYWMGLLTNNEIDGKINFLI